MLRENAIYLKKTRPTNTKVSLSMLKVKVHDNAIRKTHHYKQSWSGRVFQSIAATG